MNTSFPLALAGLLSALALHPLAASSSNFQFQCSSFVGQTGDAVVGAVIQSDGLIVLAANVSSGPFLAGEKPGGLILRLTPDGRRIILARRVGTKVSDLALDDQDRPYVAAGNDGALKFDPTLKRIIWQKDLGGFCGRIDAAPDGHCAALRYDRDDSTSTGRGQIAVFDPIGTELGRFPGKNQHTIDVCIHGPSQTVIFTGFRNANSWEGKRTYPVQIAFVRGCAYDGTPKYTLYDWSTKRDDPRFLNKPTNNMADTRGYRCAIGQDGLLYCAFECAGGNHIFRWEPQLVNGSWTSAKPKKAKGDQFHAFYNSQAEHKTFLGRYQPATGRYLAGQEFCGRLASGKANAVRMENGALTATAEGAILAGGTSAYGLPTSFLPPNTGDYKGGSFLLMLRPDLGERLYCTRFQPGGRTQAIAARRLNGRLVVAAAGTINKKKADEFWTHHAIQNQGQPGCGFLAVLQEED